MLHIQDGWGFEQGRRRFTRLGVWFAHHSSRRAPEHESNSTSMLMTGEVWRSCRPLGLAPVLAGERYQRGVNNTTQHSSYAGGYTRTLAPTKE